MWGIGMSVVSDTYMKKEKYPCSFLPSKNGIILIFFYVTFTFFKKKITCGQRSKDCNMALQLLCGQG